MRFLAAFFLTLTIFLTGPLWAQDTNGQPSGPIAIEDDNVTDAAIAVRIRDILAEIGGYEDVTVTVNAGIVTLRGQTAQLTDIEQLGALVSRVEGVVAIRNQVVTTSDLVERLDPTIDRFRDRWDQFLLFLPLALVALGAFLLIVFLGIFIARLRQPWDRLAPNAFIADIYRQVLRLAFLIAAIVIALDILGATALLGTILGAAGIIGLAIGFAVRDTVENFIASIMLSIRQPFRPNDVIEIEGDIGKVIRLTSRATILLSFDGNHIRIPNSTVFKSRIVNFTRNAERRFQFDLGVAPNTDLTQAKTIAQHTLNGLPFVLQDPPVSVWIEAIGDSTISIRSTAWINQYESSFAQARGEAIRLVMSAFDAANISMPEPTYRLMSIMDQTEPASTAAQTPADTEVDDVTREHDASLDRIIEEERVEQADNDLLSKEGKEE
ncbi:mechanosensitive ion channel family protein [Parasulfitobacter algicola]|uniref:Small-conductance mechanosensitive channel n=1 Tax=Parasulfitobacter algicola TaxID=2614809 RepID=A0ABX2ITR7_9RHOB|nr:mechanosensitive ion channel family protein [Sulfitobacter algicola]NSX55950.1 mechanosensitive ion channel [Sulfitobacter algicola]